MTTATIALQSTTSTRVLKYKSTTIVMRLPTTGSFFLFMLLSCLFIARHSTTRAFQTLPRVATAKSTTRRLHSSSFQNVGYDQMHDLVDEYEDLGREGSNIVIIDVRTHPEVQATGKISPHTHTVSVQALIEYDLLHMNSQPFEEMTGFAKPTFDETLVFTCAAGIRSVVACQAAQRAGYTSLINYTGGANEWFTKTK